MTGVSDTFLLISIFIRPSFCEDSEKKELIIAVISVFLLISVLLVVGCCFIHYKLLTTTMIVVKTKQRIEEPCMHCNNNPMRTVTKETKSFAIRTRHVEKMVLLSPSQAVPLTASPQQPPPPTAAPTPSLQSAPSPKCIQTQLSISHIYKSHSSESFHSDDLGSIYSVDHFSQLDGSPRSPSSESLDSMGSKDEEEGESSESESIILCAIQGM